MLTIERRGRGIESECVCVRGRGWSSFRPLTTEVADEDDDDADKPFAFDTLPHLPPVNNRHTHLPFEYLP